LPVEFELLKDEIEKVDELIHTGQKNYNWNSPGEILNYDELYVCVKQVDKMLTLIIKTKSNIYI